MSHGVAPSGALSILSKKDEGDATTDAREGASPTRADNDTKEGKDTHESVMDGPALDEDNERGGMRAEVSDAPTISEELSLSWSPSEKEGGGDETTGASGALSSRWWTGNVPCREGTRDIGECLDRNEGDRREEELHSKVPDAMSVCAALGVSSSTTQKEGSEAADPERAGSLTYRNDEALAQGDVYQRGRFMRAVTENDEQDDVSEHAAD